MQLFKARKPRLHSIALVSAFFTVVGGIAGWQTGRSSARLEAVQDYQRTFSEIQNHESLAARLKTAYSEILEEPHGASSEKRLAVAQAIVAYDDLIEYEKGLIASGHLCFQKLPAQKAAQLQMLQNKAVQEALNALPHLSDIFKPPAASAEDTRYPWPANQV